MKAWIYGIALLLGIMAPASSSAQRFYVKLSGRVTDHFNGDPIKGALVRVLKAGQHESEMTTRGDGKYEFELDRGWRYSIWYSADNMVTKHVNIDTEEVPTYPDVPFYEMDVQISLFPWIADFDFTPFEQPLGEASYKQSVRTMSWDLDYTERMRPILADTMDEYEKTYMGYYRRNKKKEQKNQPLPPPPAETPATAPEKQ